MRFTVGLQFANDRFLDCILEHKERIGEVYFSWGDFPNGRSDQLLSAAYTPWELQQRQIEYLGRLSAAGIGLNVLFNANCYGAESLSRDLYHRIGQTLDYIGENFGLACVTTTSPLIARFVHENFSGVATRASVNMSIGTEQGMEYLAGYFDGFYLKREYNRELETVKRLSAWCRENGKSVHMLANSGCLNHCSAHTFHDNLVAHERDIARMDNAYVFHGICREYLLDPSHHESLIRDANFIRPEDIGRYEPYVDTVKLATRIHNCPEYVLRSYLAGRYSGDILQLLEPTHSIYPYVVENGDPLRIVKIGGSYADK